MSELVDVETGGLPLNLPSHLPELADYYRALCAEHGHAPFVVMPPERSRGMVFLHEDPDRAWAEVGAAVGDCGAAVARRS